MLTIASSNPEAHWGIFLLLALSILSASEMRVVLRIALCAVLMASPIIGGLFAQGGPPVGGPPPCWPPPCIPIDGGLGFLMAAGALFGGRKALELRRAAKQVN